MNRKISRRRFLQTVGLSGAGMVGLSSYAFAIEPNWRLVVKHRPITPPNWPRDLNLKIAVIADLHAGGPSMPLERIEAIVDTTNALAPDLTVLLGDFAASYKFRTRKVAPEEWSAALGKLRAPYGVHAVLGNHDWWDDLAAQRNRKGPVIGRRMLEKQHIPVYENHAVRLRKDGEPFWIAGLGDQLAFFMGRKRGRRVFRGVDDLDGTLAKVHDHAPVILLAHEPDVFPRVTDPRVAVTLSGHTHGGQVRLFGYSPMVPSRYGNRFAYGKIVEQGRHLVVSGGLGCSILPVRLGCPPEIVLVELAGANVAAAIPNVAVAA